MKATSYIFFALLTWAASSSDVKAQTYNNFEFFYVDNSRSAMNGLGLKDTALFLLKAKLDSLKDRPSLKFMLYVSDEGRPMVSQSINNYRQMVSGLWASNTSFPNRIEDKREIRNQFYENPAQITQKMRFHFFLTDDFLRSITTQPPALTSMLPQELLDLAGTASTTAHVYIYYSNNTSTIKPDIRTSIIETIELDNFKSNIKYHLVQL